MESRDYCVLRLIKLASKHKFTMEMEEIAIMMVIELEINIMPSCAKAITIPDWLELN